MKTKILPILFILTVAGCATKSPDPLDDKYEVYQGVQQDWPTASAAFVSTDKGVIFYHGLPPRPYIVLARYSEPDLDPDDLARSAIYRKADAVCLVEHEMAWYKTNNGITLGNARVSITTPSTTTEEERKTAIAYLIRFTSTTNAP